MEAVFLILSLFPLVRMQQSAENVSEAEVCLLPPAEAGDCAGAMLNWTFTGEKCELFVYSGCGGNSNRFDSLFECRGACVRRPHACFDVDRPCEACPRWQRQFRWIYDEETDGCVRVRRCLRDDRPAVGYYWESSCLRSCTGLGEPTDLTGLATVQQ